MAWLLAVLAGTGLAGWRGQLPGVEPAPYILRFSEDRPNPLYRRICYTFAWSEVVSYALLNSLGLIDAIVNGTWRMRADLRRRVSADRRHDVGARRGRLAAARAGVHARRGPRAPILLRVGLGGVHRAAGALVSVEGAAGRRASFDVIKLAVFWGILIYVGNLARRGLLPRTRPILPGEIAVSD